MCIITVCGSVYSSVYLVGPCGKWDIYFCSAKMFNWTLLLLYSNIAEYTNSSDVADMIGTPALRVHNEYSEGAFVRLLPMVRLLLTRTRCSRPT